ncbi:MAG: hypothetical protein NPIRA04_04100 [Nitrospirales bacterium]|nr:MAG: hypothetical protein NPIRA04_04100 [Nitrospirales bacterium]
MNFTCPRASLVKTLQLFAHILEKRNSDHHALHYAVGLSTKPDHLELRATTHDQHCCLSLPASILKAGHAILPFDLLLDFLKALSQKTITVAITTKKDTIHLNAESSRLRFPLISSDWSVLAPPHPAGPSPQLTLPINVLSAMFHPVLSSVAKENGRYRLQAIQVQILPTATPTLITIGTDGQRLTRMKQETGSWVTKPNEVLTALIPKRTARLDLPPSN